MSAPNGASEIAAPTNPKPLATPKPDSELYVYKPWARKPSEEFDRRCVLITVGTVGVGKTTFLKRFVKRTFDSNERSTIGVDYVDANIYIGEHRVHVCLWDTAGQESFGSVTNSYIRQARIAVLMFDLSRPSTLDDLVAVRKKVKELAPDCICVLVGNKLDLYERNRVEGASQQWLANVDMAKHAVELECEVGYFAASAVSAQNVDTALVKAVTIFINKHERQRAELTTASRDRANLADADAAGDDNVASTGGCCDL